MFFVLLLFALVAIWTVLGTHRSPTAGRAVFRRRIEPAAESVSTHGSSVGHYRAKSIEVREGLFRIALEAPDASCRKIADRFNHDHLEVGLSVDKTYVAEFLREFKQWRAAPKRHEHSIDTTCAVNRVWAIDITRAPRRTADAAAVAGHSRSWQQAHADVPRAAGSIIYHYSSVACGCHRTLRHANSCSHRQRSNLHFLGLRLRVAMAWHSSSENTAALSVDERQA